MSIHVLVVGYPTQNKAVIEPAAWRASDHPGFIVVRCGPPAELWRTLRDIVIHESARIDMLDIFDHAAHGVQYLSGEALFGYNHPSGLDIARKIKFLFTPDARVRLLGCEVAVGPHGKALLLDLQDAFGGSVVVYGTLESTHGLRDFDCRGFRSKSDEIKLYSSTEARAAPAYQVPAVAAHDAAMTEFLGQVREMDP